MANLLTMDTADSAVIFPLYRSVALFLARNGDHKNALYFLNLANELRPEDRKSLHARGMCKVKLGDLNSALEDAQKYIDMPSEPGEINPHVKGFYTKGLALYHLGEFEQALVQFHKGRAIRMQPPYFQEGVMVGTETIEDSIGRNVQKPLLDHLEEIKKMAEIKRKENETGQKFLISNSIRCKDQPVIEIKPSKNTYWKEKHELDLMKKRYLGHLAEDLKFAESLKESRCLSQFINVGKCRKILELANTAESVLQSTKETLRMRKPYYSVKYLTDKQEESMQRQKKARFLEKAAMTHDKANRMLQILRALRKKRKIKQFFVNAHHIKEYLDSKSVRLLPKKQEYLNTLYNLAALVYLDSHYLPPHKTHQEQIHLMHIFYGLPTTREYTFDTEFKHIALPSLDHRKIYKGCKVTLDLAETVLERITLLYMMARAVMDSCGSIEHCRVLARQALMHASSTNNLAWMTNICILLSRIEMRSGDRIDAKEAITAAHEYAKLLKNEELIHFTKMALETIETSDTEDSGIKSREKEILTIALATGLHRSVVDLFQHMASLPRSKCMSILPQYKSGITRKTTKLPSSKGTMTSGSSE